MVAVAYERLSFTRGSKYNELTGKTLQLVFWKRGRLQDVHRQGGSPVCVKNLNSIFTGRGGGGVFGGF